MKNKRQFARKKFIMSSETVKWIKMFVVHRGWPTIYVIMVVYYKCIEFSMQARTSGIKKVYNDHATCNIWSREIFSSMIINNVNPNHLLQNKNKQRIRISKCLHNQFFFSLIFMQNAEFIAAVYNHGFTCQIFQIFSILCFSSFFPFLLI